MMGVVNGADGEERPGVGPVPGMAIVGIVVILAVLVGLAWLVEIATARNAGVGDPSPINVFPIAGAQPADALPSAASSTRPGSPGATGTPSSGATHPPTGGRGGSLPVQVAASWVTTIADRTDIPDRALTAYADAQLVTNVTRPSCHLSWVMLAGIGLIESGHGGHGGAVLMPDGTTSIPILGPALDGTHGNKAVRATPEGVRLDGDPRWDHAVGPMQFLPSTWSHWGVSANGGVPNPEDIDDAALTAADYLCGNGRDLSTVNGWRAALAAYNAPDSYALKVTNAANRYAHASLG
jgi:hypothetical protein